MVAEIAFNYGGIVEILDFARIADFRPPFPAECRHLFFQRRAIESHMDVEALAVLDDTNMDI